MSKFGQKSGISRVLFLFCAVLAFMVAIPAIAQEDVIRVDTELVTFEVVVEDRLGNPVYGLKADDFRIFEDGIERRIDFFQPVSGSGKTRPLSIIFALDVSGSMTADETEKLKTSLGRFIERFADFESYFAMMSFAMNVRTIQSFTNKPDALKKSFAKIRRDQDGLSTHAYDAVDDAVRLMAKKSPKTLRGRHPKRAVVVISDGFPVGDTVAPETVIERANAAEISVYSVILPSFSPMQRNTRPLMTPFEASGLVQRTGGKSLYVSDSGLEPIFRSLAEEITASYAIAFYPNEGAEGQYHNVRIESKKGYRIKQNRMRYERKK